jgi:ankyrin repeat protein
MSVDPKTQSLFAAIAAVNYSQVKYLIESGVPVNIVDDRGKTPLAVACVQGHLEIVDLLMASGARMYLQSDVSPVESNARSRIASIPGDWDFTSIEHEVAESPLTNRQVAYEDLLDLLHQPTESEKSPQMAHNEGTTNLTASVRATPGQNLRKMATGWREMESDAEATCTFDLDEVFAANDKLNSSGVVPPSRSEMFIESEQTMTALGGSANPSEWEANETYAFDLSQDRLQSGFGKRKQPVPHLSNIGEWDEGETYAMDLSNLDGDGGETYAIDLDCLLGEDSPVNSLQLAELQIEDDLLDDDDSNYDPGETYAFDLDDLDPYELMDGDITTPHPQRDVLSEITAKLSPIGVGVGKAFAEPNGRLSPKPTAKAAPGENRQATSTANLDLPQASQIEAVGVASPLEMVSQNRSPGFDKHPLNTSLLSAIATGDLDLTKQLVATGADLVAYDWDLGYCPLGMAIDRGQLQIVQFLLSAGANPHGGSTSTTALGLATAQGELEMIQMLLSSKVDVNAPVAADGWTALLAAVKNGHYSIVKLLVTAGANVNVWSRNETAILLAAKGEEREIYQYLYPLVNTAIRLCADRDAEQLLSAAHKRRIRAQNWLVEKFINMATAGNLDEVRSSIASGVEIDEFCAKGHNALMAAAYYGHQPVVNILLEAGSNPNLLSDGEDGLGYGMSALMFVASSFFASNRDTIAKLLITGGADVDRQSEKGKTAIMFAAIAGSGYRACVEILIAAGANLNLRDNRGHTVLSLVAAAENYPMFNLLLQAGASTDGLESIQLIQAARAGNVDRVKSLLSAQVNVNLDRGDAIGSAAAAGYTEIVKLLIQAGANVNLSDRSGFTPLASAAYAGYGAIVRLLIDAGADIQASAGEPHAYSVLEYAQMGLRQFGGIDRQHAQIIHQLSLN